MVLYVKYHDPWNSGTCCGGPDAGPNTPLTKGAANHWEAGIFQAALDATNALIAVATKVEQTSDPFKTYITDPSGLQSVLDWALLPTPLTFAVRDAAGQLQVGNPVIASDAVNLFTLEQKILTFYLVVARSPYTIWNGAITLDAFGAPISAAVVWPDGSTGTYTGTPSATFPGSVDAWTITYDDGPFTFTQPAVTRDGNGNITFQPAITIT